jgi:hypothetical protein
VWLSKKLKSLRRNASGLLEIKARERGGRVRSAVGRAGGELRVGGGRGWFAEDVGIESCCGHLLMLTSRGAVLSARGVEVAMKKVL